MSTVAAVTSPSSVERRARPAGGRRRCRRRACRRRRARRAPRPRRGVRMPLPLISAMPPSALKRSISASAPSVPGFTTIRPSAPMPRWRSQSARCAGTASAETARDVEPRPHEEVVAGGVQLGERGRQSCAPACQEGGRARARILRGAEPGDAGVAPEPHALAAGEPPGARRRRPRARRRATARSPVEVAEDLPVADGLARRCATARRGPASAAHLVDQTGVAHGRDPCRRSARPSTARGSQTPDHADREHGVAVRLRARRRTTRTGGR